MSDSKLELEANTKGIDWRRRLGSVKFLMFLIACSVAITLFFRFLPMPFRLLGLICLFGSMYGISKLWIYFLLYPFFRDRLKLNQDGIELTYSNGKVVAHNVEQLISIEYHYKGFWGQLISKEEPWWRRNKRKHPQTYDGRCNYLVFNLGNETLAVEILLDDEQTALSLQEMLGKYSDKGVRIFHNYH